MPRRSTIRLNKRIVDALAVERGDAVFWDREVSGFGVRVITGRNPGDRLKNLDMIWQRLRARADLDDVRLHDCRHSCATRPNFYEISSDFSHHVPFDLTVLERFSKHISESPRPA